MSEEAKEKGGSKPAHRRKKGKKVSELVCFTWYLLPSARAGTVPAAAPLASVSDTSALDGEEALVARKRRFFVRSYVRRVKGRGVGVVTPRRSRAERARGRRLSHLPPDSRRALGERNRLNYQRSGLRGEARRIRARRDLRVPRRAALPLGVSAARRGVTPRPGAGRVSRAAKGGPRFPEGSAASPHAPRVDSPLPLRSGARAGSTALLQPVAKRAQHLHLLTKRGKEVSLCSTGALHGERTAYPRTAEERTIKSACCGDTMETPVKRGLLSQSASSWCLESACEVGSPNTCVPRRVNRMCARGQRLSLVIRRKATVKALGQSYRRAPPPAGDGGFRPS
ncbi:hypothetical protein SKAU_G00144780 [Synaphobranchus kaupii]|uniref:Uncharacterized protein n=1 Tax=Synaphobranchus kaupii TaxID=118154 RepID=A0A9Q1FT25_SYNKA|nr:hypothetical protein SKAU_G00144780 [Synaphobranchus kaupii]